MKIRAAASFLIWIAAFGSEGQKAEPRFAAGNQLIRPEGYREWVFVGSGLGMSYSEGPYEKAPDFTNIYIQPEAFRQFAATGKFPDGTVLVMEVVSAGSKASINQRGQFEERCLGVEAAVKDENRFPEKWAYFSFIGADGKALDQARPFPKQACWKCHNEHGAVDNVFVQFYPVLRDACKMSHEPERRPATTTGDR